jgi:16S rRNA (uracil1498-N3)-methyltransferase
MQVRRSIVERVPEAGVEVALADGEGHHAGKVLRLRPGDRLDLLDGAGTRAEAVVVSGPAARGAVGVVCRVLRRETCPEPALSLRLYIAPPRAGGMSEVVRCATELGVRRVSPILCRFGVSRPDAAAREGWLRDALAALKQSGNAFLPVLDLPCPFAEALSRALEPGVFGAVPRPGARLASRRPAGPALGVWIGPEGGFSDEEEAALVGKGFAPLTVGPWVLRVETAVAALIGRLWGEAGHA